MVIDFFEELKNWSFFVELFKTGQSKSGHAFFQRSAHNMAADILNVLKFSILPNSANRSDKINDWYTNMIITFEIKLMYYFL